MACSLVSKLPLYILREEIPTNKVIKYRVAIIVILCRFALINYLNTRLCAETQKTTAITVILSKENHNWLDKLKNIPKLLYYFFYRKIDIELWQFKTIGPFIEISKCLYNRPLFMHH